MCFHVAHAQTEQTFVNTGERGRRCLCRRHHCSCSLACSPNKSVVCGLSADRRKASLGWGHSVWTHVEIGISPRVSRTGAVSTEAAVSDQKVLPAKKPIDGIAERDPAVDRPDGEQEHVVGQDETGMSGVSLTPSL